MVYSQSVKLKKYLISIEKENSPRLSAFFSQPTFQTFKNEFIQFGIIGANLSTSEYFKLAISGRERALSPAELGCTLSHMSAVRDFLNSEEQYACIFEDDAHSVEHINLDELESEIQALNLKSGFFLSMGGIQLSLNRQIRGTFLPNKLLSKKVLAIHPYYYGKLSYAYAYVIDRTMAKYLVEYHQQPQLYDNWDNFSQHGLQPHFYASFLFDHPDIDQCNIKNSYLNAERKSLIKIKSTKRTALNHFKNSALKRFYKLILQLYSRQ